MSSISMSKRRRLRDPHASALRRIVYEEFWRQVAHFCRLSSGRFVDMMRDQNLRRRAARGRSKRDLAAQRLLNTLSTSEG